MTHGETLDDCADCGETCLNRNYPDWDIGLICDGGNESRKISIKTYVHNKPTSPTNVQ
jgi:hypothetical protein